MRRVIIESPFAGDRARNHRYLLDAIRDCYARGEAPIASHLVGPLVLDDDDPEQRSLGIAAGLAWHRVADWVVVMRDLGISPGMEAAIAHAQRVGVPVVFRSLPAWSPLAQKEVAGG